jgi:hypothetical protein
MSTVERISPQQPELSDVVLACFRQACSEGRLDVAEHLLVAIEELSKEGVGANNREHHLAEAYGVLLDVMPPRQSADASQHNRER